MFLNQSFFDEDDNGNNNNHNNNNNNQVSSTHISNHGNAKEKLEQRRQLLNRAARPRSARGSARVRKNDANVFGGLGATNQEDEADSIFNDATFVRPMIATSTTLGNDGIMASSHKHSSKHKHFENSQTMIDNFSKSQTMIAATNAKTSNNLSNGNKNMNINQNNHSDSNNNNGNIGSIDSGLSNLKMNDNKHENNNLLTNNHNNNNISSNNSSSKNSNNNEKLNVDWNNLDKFLTMPCSANRRTTFQTQIIRNKSGIANKIYPQYEVFLKDSDKVLMFGKKQAANKTSNYYIATNCSNFEKLSKQDDNSNLNNKYLAKVRSNFAGTEFIVYDNGRSPKDLSNPSQLRCELACVMYETNILGTKGPRKMHVLIPDMSKDGNQIKLQPTGADSLMLSSYRQKLKHNIRLLQNKSPKWNDQIGAYVLNFDGRVTMASVKNFQLVFEDSPETVILQFGRIGKDKFTMDFRYPLSPLQAFGICLSSFDNKLACE